VWALGRRVDLENAVFKRATQLSLMYGYVGTFTNEKEKKKG
jgi:hypothetical protein